MKNRIFILLLACFFFTGSFAFTNIDGGITLSVTSKNGTNVCTISIPDNYVNKIDQLAFPLEVTIYNGEIPVYTEYSNDLIISIPSRFRGIYFVEIKIGNISFYEKVNL